MQSMTTKIPPGFDGKMSWFTYEDAIDEWEDITELDQEKRGPALRNKLCDDAAYIKPLLDREKLIYKDDGVKYFKRTVRPYFIKNNESVFMWRLFQLFSLYRKSGDMLKWTTRMTVHEKRLKDAWMDLLPEYDASSDEYRQAVAANNADQLNTRYDPDDPDVFDRWLANTKAAHMKNYPFTDNLYSLITLVLADLSEIQRERFMTSMILRKIKIQDYTF